MDMLKKRLQDEVATDRAILKDWQKKLDGSEQALAFYLENGR